jgi:hypothetical protein
VQTVIERTMGPSLCASVSEFQLAEGFGSGWLSIWAGPLPPGLAGRRRASQIGHPGRISGDKGVTAQRSLAHGGSALSTAGSTRGRRLFPLLRSRVSRLLRGSDSYSSQGELR